MKFTALENFVLYSNRLHILISDVNCAGCVLSIHINKSLLTKLLLYILCLSNCVTLLKVCHKIILFAQPT